MNKELLKKEMDKLLEEAEVLLVMFCYKAQSSFNFDDKEQKIIKENNPKDYSLDTNYNSFYTRCHPIIAKILPKRIEEFEWCYIGNNKEFSKYDISTYLRRVKAVTLLREYEIEALTLFERQMNILKGACDLLDSALFSIENDIRTNIFTDELSMAEHLLSKKYTRAAGSVAGVVLEAHLKNVAMGKGKDVKKDDSISTYNAFLKNYIGDITWGRIESISRIRNKCDHSKGEEPTKKEVEFLILETKFIMQEVM